MDGTVLLTVIMCSPFCSSTGSTAGQVLGTVHAVPTGEAGVTSGAETLPSSDTTPVTAGGLAPGQVLDPSAPGYGVTI